MKEGAVLNLTCTIDSFPPSAIMWTKQNTNLTEKTGRDLREHTGTSTLIIYNVTVQESGQYFCKANHWMNLTQDINITVICTGTLQLSFALILIRPKFMTFMLKYMLFTPQTLAIHSFSILILRCWDA